MPKTKIIATIGPASEKYDTIEKMILSGVSCFRFNTKHGELAWHKKIMARVRHAAQKLNTNISICLDLQGPEVRIGTIKNNALELKNKDLVLFGEGKNKQYPLIPLQNQQVIKQIKSGNTIYLDDGFIELLVVKKYNKACLLRVIQGGMVKSNKSANFPDIELDMPSLSEKDLTVLAIVEHLDIDWVALSFVREAKDLSILKKLLAKKKINAGVISKIETKKAVKNIEEIIDASDAVMVARGDLAVEFDYQKVPYIQKEIIASCRIKAKPVIVATQMLLSMVQNPRPTRAEISDVANAIYDSTDALMLSEESAAGKFPLKSVKTMAEIASFIESKKQKEYFRLEPHAMNELVTKAAFDISQSQYAAENDIDKIVVLTETGLSARLLARFHPRGEIIAVSASQKTVNRLLLSYAVLPVYRPFPKGRLHSSKWVIEKLKKLKIVKKGEKVLLIHGENWGNPGRTNTLRIQEVY